MTWELWRQDDNGNRFLVGRFDAVAAAEAKLARLTRTHHKQSYWIEAIRPRAGSIANEPKAGGHR